MIIQICRKNPDPRMRYNQNDSTNIASPKRLRLNPLEAIVMYFSKNCSKAIHVMTNARIFFFHFSAWIFTWNVVVLEKYDMINGSD